MRLFIIIFSALLITTFSQPVFAQKVVKPTTQKVGKPTKGPKVVVDSVKLKAKNDSIAKSKDKLKAKVEYQASDSLTFDFKDKKAFLYSEAEIKYQKTDLKAATIEIDFDKSIAHARSVKDTTGKEIGTPVFSDNGTEFKSKILDYNYETKKGFIKGVVTKEGEGYIHGKQVKKMADDVTNIKDGSYTTCDLEHPHFELRFSRAKVIPNKETITGPAYMVLEDVPLPIGVPFGFFPNKNGRMSGIFMPSPGESGNRGFYIRDFGYYWGISDNLDAQIKGEAYTRGSWAVYPTINYFKRYKYQGNFNLRYAVNILGEKGAPDYQQSKDFSINWMHTQDAKANPVNRFSANVNIQTSKFNKFNPTTVGNYLSNTFSSSISYQTSIDDRIFISTSARHSQNTITKQMSVTFPDLSVSANRWFPFKREEGSGKKSWYEDISIGYSLVATNQLDTYDSLLTKKGMLKRLKNGAQHSIPISSTFKLFKYVTVSNSVNLTENWYLNYINKKWLKTTYKNTAGTTRDTAYVAIDTLQGFKASHDLSYSLSMNTTAYGMVQFKKGFIRAIRHVISPSISYSFKPDFSAASFGYYKNVQTDNLGTIQKYSIFEQSVYGGPTANKAGSISFNLRNNLEMKIKDKKDTVTGTRKIKIIDQLNISTNYDMSRDSLRWSKVFVSGNTPIFKNTNINFSGTWDPYAYDKRSHQDINMFEWEMERKLLRYENSNWSFGLSHQFSSNDGKKKTPTNTTTSAIGIDPKKSLIPNPDDSQATVAEKEDIIKNPNNYIDWKNAWTFGVNYTFNMTSTKDPTTGKVKNDLIQSMMFNGDISITNKWKVTFTSGYDFLHSQISYTSFTINRDLHCFEIRFNWIPLGTMKSWDFTIRAKSNLLQDLKLTKRKDFRDNLY
jgi:hypothetical protein